MYKKADVLHHVLSFFSMAYSNTLTRSTRLLSFLLLLAGGAYASYQDFGIPASRATVDVRVFNVANMTLPGQTQSFIAPVLPGHEAATFPMYSFLVEHKQSNKRLQFDLGIRIDPQNTVPSLSGPFNAGFIHLEPYKDITTLLQDGGIALSSIDAVIWSHAHFDHVGDMSKFPNTTGLIIGGATDISTFPGNPNSTLQVSDLVGHKITKVDFTNATLSFSGLKAVDYFGDGSFYLLDTPGHLLGHMTALARVTPTSFVVLGGDTFHHAGQARPRPQFQKAFPCPAHLLEESKSAVSTDYFWSHGTRVGAFDILSRAQQLLSISDVPGSFYADPTKSQVSLEKVASFDADPDFLVIAAHDLSLRSSIPYFPAYINGWKASSLKEGLVWNFIDQTNPAFVFSPTNQTA
ncbi:Metallo-beta-lactamase superfamily protein [Mycena venus]|uniref:Metallo-beta-lactamase superfamily protein n=1 Tax=Mycena venus TaxID=2733690 RepID=A0A8H6YL53_9AGAR|nr:Metallo-beta-lactamase superfamily protein [Mycena venus]